MAKPPKLSDLVNSARRRASVGSNLANNPLAVARQRAYRWALTVYKKLPVPFLGRSTEEQNSEPERGEVSVPNTAANHSVRTPSHPPSPTAVSEQHYPVPPQAYPAARNGGPRLSAPAVTRYSSTVSPIIFNGVQADAQETDSAAFLTDDEGQRANFYPSVFPPILPQSQKLPGGYEGSYIVGRCCENQGWMRRYEGVQESDGELVWIYEYCLSEYNFGTDGDEITQRRKLAQLLFQQNSRLGDGSDFRLLKPKDIICPENTYTCYLISKALPVKQQYLLADYLTGTGKPASAYQIKTFFRQLLQTLQYLRTYRVSWPAGTSEVGLPHGALRPESLWLKFSEMPAASGEHPFFVYVSRFALWEHLFYQGEGPYVLQPMATATHELGSVSKDLAELAHSGFAFIQGRLPSGDPRDKSQWPEDPAIRVLYPFVRQLLGEGGGSFGIEEAIACLANLPEVETFSQEPALLLAEPVPQVEQSEYENPEQFADLEQPVESERSGFGCFYAGLGVLLLGAGAFALFRLARMTDILSPCPSGCLLSDVDDAPEGIRYAIAPDSTWITNFARTLSNPLEPKDGLEFLLEQALEDRNGRSYELKKLDADELEKLAVDSSKTLMERLATRTDTDDESVIHAGFVRAPEDEENVESEVVAYDGIAVFVAYSDAHGERQSIPELLNGKISRRELQDLFSGETNELKGEKVTLYSPKDEDVVKIFYDFLFTGENAPSDILERGVTLSQMVERTSVSENMKSDILKDFESLTDKEIEDGSVTISIGFDRVSQVVGQCQVYPLTVTHKLQSFPVLVDDDGKPIDVDTDLCGDKGTYWADASLFEQGNYLFGYELSIAYPINCSDLTQQRCDAGENLKDKLLTMEGQYLLSEVGLVPVTPIQDIRDFLWR